MKSTKRQIIDRGLFIYGGLVAIVLTVIAILNLKKTNSLTTLLLFLPVSIYFIFRFFVSMVESLEHFMNRDQKRLPYFGNFSLGAFFRQNDTLFLFTQLLFSTAVALILFRISLALLR